MINYISSIHEYPNKMELNYLGGFYLITKKDDIETVHKIIDDGKRFCESYDDLMNYVSFCLEELAWIN